MDREKAIQILKRCEAESHCEHYKRHYCCIGCGQREALDLAIEALKEPTVSEDCISRQAAIDAVEKAVFKGVAKSAIESLPPVEPKPVMTEEVREALMRLTMCAREECSICKYENDCGYDKQVKMATENMNTILNVFLERPKTTETMMVDGEPTEIDPLSYEVGYSHGQPERPKGRWIDIDLKPAPNGVPFEKCEE